MDFSGQVRAARAYLQWSQERFADEVGMSVQGIQKIEYGESKPTMRTQERIVRSLKKRGISFSVRGIEYEENPIVIIEGETQEEVFLLVLDDVQEHLMGLPVKDRELLIMYSDDSVSTPAVNNAYKKIRASGIRMRQMIKEGNEYLMGAPEEYRYVPERFFINRVTLVYGERIAHETGNILKHFIRIDEISAAIQRNTFNILWSVLQQPKRTIADERF